MQLSTNKLSFLFLQETMVRNKPHFNFKNYKLIFKPNDNGAATRGLAVFIRSDFKIDNVISSTSEKLIIKCSSSMGSVIVCNVHAPNYQNKRIQKNFFTNLKKEFTNFQKIYKNCCFIVAGDMNCSIGSHNYNSEFHKFTKTFDQVSSSNFKTRGNYCIDYILTKNYYINSFKCKNHSFHSDHNYLVGKSSYSYKNITNKRIKISNIDEENLNKKKLNLRNYQKYFYKFGKIKVITDDITPKKDRNIEVIRKEIKKISNNYKKNFEKKLNLLKKKFYSEIQIYNKNIFIKIKEEAYKKPFKYLKKKEKLAKIETKDNFLSLFVNNENKYKYDKFYLKENNKKNPNVTSILYDISEVEVKNIITKLGKTKNTSPGPDGIDYLILSKITNFQEITKNFNSILFNKEEFPKGFQDSILIPIKKKGGGIRPISLLNCLFKVYCIIIFNRLQPINIIKTQYGFKKNFNGCELNLIKYKSMLERMTNNSLSSVINWDIKQAFDSVNLKWLKFSLKSVNINKESIKSILNTVNGNQRYYKWCARVSNGARQGNPLSPLLFNISINILLEKLYKLKDVKIVAYADDISTYCRNEKSEIKVNDIFHEFLEISRFSLNYNKCEKIKNGENKAIKYLGILFEIINYNVSFKKHIQLKEEKLFQKINFFINKKFILPKFKVYYLNALLTSITYGCLIFTDIKEQIRLLDTKIRKVICKSFGIFHSDPDVLEHLLGLNSLSKLIEINRIEIAKRNYSNSSLLRKQIILQGVKSGTPGLPCNFNLQTTKKKRNFLFHLNEVGLKYGLKLLTYSEKSISGINLKIRSRRNLLKMNSFFFDNITSRSQVKKLLGYKMKENNYKILKSSTPNANPIIINENTLQVYNSYSNEPLDKKKDLKKFIKEKFYKKKWDVPINQLNTISAFESLKNVRFIIRIINSTLPTFKFLFNIKLKNSKICIICKKSEEDINHIFFECEAYDSIRHECNIVKEKSITYILKNLNSFQKILYKRNLLVHKFEQN